ncbi:hypothetical protein OROMI_022147 [Orobanche minor]
MGGIAEECSSQTNRKKLESQRGHGNKDIMPESQVWTDGLICAFEFIRGHKKSVAPKSFSNKQSSHQVNHVNVKNQMHSDGGGSEPTSQKSNRNILQESAPLVELESSHPMERCEGSFWAPIGWARISELVQSVEVDEEWSTQHFMFTDDDDDLTVADLAAPYWERPAGPTWWCHLDAGHPTVEAWLIAAQWLHPAIRTALRDESRLISDRMKHLLYEVHFFV